MDHNDGAFDHLAVKWLGLLTMGLLTDRAFDLDPAKALPMLDDIRTLELDRLQISSTSGPRLCVYTVYHPPRGTKLSGTKTEFYSDHDILFTETSLTTIPVIILVDFNIHFNDEHNSLLNDYQMQQHINSATHELGNTLDLVITNQRDNLDSNVSVMDYEISDHFSV